MAGLTEVPDERLLKLMRRGSEDAFTTLYRRRQGAIYRFALEMSGSTSVAEEVTQEVFMVLIQDQHGFDPSRGSLAAFLLGVARHLVLRSLKREGLLVSIANAAGDGEDFAPVSADDPHSTMSRQESISSVQQAVLSLPGHYREAVVLCDLNELSYEEAASVLECSVGTVRSRLHRGRALLVQKLTGRRKIAASDKALDPSRCPA